MNHYNYGVLVITCFHNSTNIYKQLLQDQSKGLYQVVTAESSHSSVTLCRSQRIDTILLDASATENCTVEVLEQLQMEMGEECPPIIVVDRDDIKLAVQAMKAGAADYLIRDDITSNTLTQAIESAIAQAQRASKSSKRMQALETHQEDVETELTDAQLLQQISTQLIQEDNLNAFYEQVLDAAIALMRSDMASLQLFDPKENALHLLTHRGLNSASVKFWQWVKLDSNCCCGMAFKAGQRVIIPNVDTVEEILEAEDYPFFQLSKIKAVQSTPLMSRQGQLMGIIATYWQQPYQPSQQKLHLLDAIARQITDLLEQQQTQAQLRENLAKTQLLRNHRSTKREQYFVDLLARQAADFIEQRQLLEREQTAREEAERNNRIKDEFLSILSHELRTPLNPILTWAQLLQTQKFDAKRTAKALATIERSAIIQTQLIDDLFDLARILRGKLTLNLTSVDLCTVVEAAIETVTTAGIGKSIAIHSELSSLPKISADPVRLQQIIWNLLSNAIKFTPEGGTVKISLTELDNQAQITLRDTGRGISPEFLPYVFESFRQQDPSLNRQFGGLGLGLSIVRYLVEAHGGTITAESPGKGLGATFTVRLPLVSVELQNPPTEQLSNSETDLSGIRVLAVDDEADARELLTVILTAYKAEVRTAASAVEALTMLESFQPDILVSDLAMVERDGYDLMQRIRALPAEAGGQISAIALTAYAQVEDQQRAIASGYQTHLAKPIDIKQLVRTIANLAGHPREAQALTSHSNH